MPFVLMMLFDGPLFVRVRLHVVHRCWSRLLVDRVKPEILELQNDPTSIRTLQYQFKSPFLFWDLVGAVGLLGIGLGLDICCSCIGKYNSK